MPYVMDTYLYQKDLLKVVSHHRYREREIDLKFFQHFQNYLFELTKFVTFDGIYCADEKVSKRKKNLRIFLRLNDFRKYIFCD